MHRLHSAYFAQMIICFPKMFLSLGSIFLPAQSKVISESKRFVVVHSLAAIFNFCFYCREHEENVSFAL